MTTSLVTVTFNRALQLDRGMRSILSQEVLPGEIVLVDDGSTDNTKEVVEKLKVDFPNMSFNYIYLDHPEHRISCIPRNVGIKAAHGDVIIFTEPEVLHVGNTVKQILAKLVNHPNHTPLATQVWTIQRKIYEKLTQDNFDRPATILTHPYAQLTNDTNLSNTRAPDSDWAITGSNHCIVGCLFAVERRVLMDMGGFDESLTEFGWDDFNLFDRLALYGKGIRPCDDIIVIHQWHEKNYPYNIYEAGDRNGKKSQENIKEYGWRANVGKEWGEI